jgi:hypothetical protein
MKHIKASLKRPVIRPSIVGVSHELISERAYTLWLHQGRPENRDVEHWLQAEAQSLVAKDSK